MTRRDQHVPFDRLTALAFAARSPQEGSPESPEDRRALSHLSRCDQCAAAFARLAADADGLRELAFAQADQVFDDGMLDAQRTRILDRLAHIGQAARVLNFPRPTREVVMPSSSSSRRWVSVAAAAGLIIGLVAGQTLRFVPSGVSSREGVTTIQTPDRSGSAMIIPASTASPLTDDELMEEVEVAVRLRRAQSLQALDGLTPTAADLLAMGR
jgi:hypothetical protein